MATITWVVVSDGAHCNIFQHIGGSENLTFISHKEGDHRPDRELNADDVGRSFDSHGKGRHRYEPKHSSHKMLKVDFVEKVVNEIEEEYRKNRFDGLILVCPPTTLGYFREKFSTSICNIIKSEINKDLTQAPPVQIFTDLRAFLLPMRDFKEQLEIRP